MTWENIIHTGNLSGSLFLVDLKVHETTANANWKPMPLIPWLSKTRSKCELKGQRNYFSSAAKFVKTLLTALNVRAFSQLIFLSVRISVKQLCTLNLIPLFTMPFHIKKISQNFRRRILSFVMTEDYIYTSKSTYRITGITQCWV